MKHSLIPHSPPQLKVKTPNRKTDLCIPAVHGMGIIILIPVLSLEYAGSFGWQRLYLEIYHRFIDSAAVRQSLPFKRARRASGPPLARLLLSLAS